MITQRFGNRIICIFLMTLVADVEQAIEHEWFFHSSIVTRKAANPYLCRLFYRDSISFLIKAPISLVPTCFMPSDIISAVR